MVRQNQCGILKIAFALGIVLGVGQVTGATPLTTELVASGLTSPVFVTYAPGDSNRIFILEQPGRIRVVRNDSLQASPFLDIIAIVGSGASERGLLGLAFHPNYQANGYFFVYYTNNSGNTVVARYKVSSNPGIALTDSSLTVITINQPFSNHNGGMIGFGPDDGFLYIGTGDGGAGGDPGNRAQNGKNLLGKLLRIDIDTGTPYAIPSDNPFVSDTSFLDEIWGLGLRNPWRFAFDRVTGDLYIADVGQNEFEEIDYQTGSSSGGENYGWRLKEGIHCFNPPTGCESTTGLTEPITEYSHGGIPFRCSITGGYVYRGCAIPDLQGAYFYADYCSGQIWSFRYNGSAITDSVERTSELGLGSVAVSSFGEDYSGELYICSYWTGEIFRIVPDGVPSQCGLLPCCTGLRGDLNGDGTDSNILYLTFLIDFIFRGSEDSGFCPEESDVNSDGNIADILDLTYVVDFVFRGGSQPLAC